MLCNVLHLCVTLDAEMGDIKNERLEINFLQRCFPVCWFFCHKHDIVDEQCVTPLLGFCPPGEIYSAPSIFDRKTRH